MEEAASRNRLMIEADFVRVPQIRVTAQALKADDDLLEGCRQQNRDSFRKLFEIYKDRVYSIAFYYFKGDENAARDVTQQVFLKLMERIGQFRGASDFDTWLYRMVVNTCLDEQRRIRRLIPIEDPGLVARATFLSSAETRQVQAALSESVLLAVDSLKPALKAVVILKYFEDLSYSEIARILGCATGTVASRLNRAHRILSRKLAGWRGSPRGE